MAVNLAQAGGDRVDNHQPNVANSRYSSFKQRQIGLQIESTASFSVAFVDRRNQMDRADIRSGCIEARTNSVGSIVFGRKDKNASFGRTAFITRPMPSRRYRCRKCRGNLTFAEAGF